MKELVVVLLLSVSRRLTDNAPPPVRLSGFRTNRLRLMTHAVPDITRIQYQITKRQPDVF